MAEKYPDEKYFQIQGKGFKGTKVKDMKQDLSGSICHFAYQAEYSGTRGKNMPIGDNYYDATPMIVYLNSTNGGFYGMNMNYLSVVGRATFIATWRLGVPTQPQMFERMIHRYKYANMLTPFYKINNLTADPQILASSAQWTRIRNTRLPRKTGAPGSI